MITQLKNTEAIRPLFAHFENTMVEACFSGGMGGIYAQSENPIRSAAATLGDFCFFAGEPSEALLRFEEEQAGGAYRILVPQGIPWLCLMEKTFPKRLRACVRYAAKMDAEVSEEHLLQAVRALPKGYVIRPIDGELYKACLREEWSRDLTGVFTDYADFERRGVGMAVLQGGTLVGGASSYAAWEGGIAVQVDTHWAHRRRGIALASSAALLLACKERGIYPDWDAHHKASLALAQKLGYAFSHAYPTYERLF